MGNLFKNATASSLLSPEELPFANEVDAALSRKPSYSARMLSIAVAVLFLVLFIWSAFASLDEITHAEGQVIAAQRTQSIQNLEGGILQEVMVREGEVVEKGAPLARLDNEFAASTYRDAVNKALENFAAIIRLDAELSEQEPKFPENLSSALEGIGHDIQNEEDMIGKSQEIIADQMAIYRAKMQHRKAELEVLQSQYTQREQEVKEQIARKRQLDRNLSLTLEQHNIAYQLMQHKNYSRVEFLSLEQKVVSLRGESEQLAASIPKTQAAAMEAKQRIASRTAELNSAAVDERNKCRAELTSLRESLSAGGDRVTRTELRSPVYGTVQRIYITTVGGVVKPGESIMDIVPLDDTLLIEARVRPTDVAFLHPGQNAMVKITAYDFGIYGGLEGTLEQISADTIEDKRGDFYYLAKVRTKRNSITYHEKELPIIPGMMATADIMIGKKTVLDYLLKPILKARQNALRER